MRREVIWCSLIPRRLTLLQWLCRRFVTASVTGASSWGGERERVAGFEWSHQTCFLRPLSRVLNQKEQMFAS